MMTCYLVGYFNLPMSFVCNVIEEVEDQKASLEIYLPSTGYHGSRKMKQILRHTKQTIHCGGAFTSNDLNNP
jgi:hypothetical protein